MANEFIIKKGHSSRLGLIAQEDLIENGWYLTTDTAEVYVALRQTNGLLALKKINECDIDNDLSLESFESRLEALEAERTHIYGYRKDFPSKGERDHMYIAEDEHRTYMFTQNAGGRGAQFSKQPHRQIPVLSAPVPAYPHYRNAYKQPPKMR